MPGMANFDTGVGQVVGGNTDASDRGSVRDWLHPGTEAGQALMVAAIAAVILALTIGRESPGLRKVVAVAYFVLIVNAADAVGNYFLRTFLMRHPDAPAAAGLTIAF